MRRSAPWFWFIMVLLAVSGCRGWGNQRPSRESVIDERMNPAEEPSKRSQPSSSEPRPEFKQEPPQSQ
ncbi:MAG: hypothetical protein HYZ93_01930 [Candidatus Omnitrophica bacterium]|nr:hypothetical protein [Candidatus Omnitrophota bacterium]